MLDYLIERTPPFDPMSVISEVAQVLRGYGLDAVTGDRYAAEFNFSMFAACGVNYRNSDRDRSAIYQDVGPLFTSGRVRLIDSRKLVAQFAGLERKPGPLGKDRVDHSPGRHDDLSTLLRAHWYWRARPRAVRTCCSDDERSERDECIIQVQCRADRGRAP